jgi:hypothetical protein
VRWIGKHIFDLKTTFKDDVVIEKTITTSGGGSVGTTDLTATTATDQITINSSSGDNVIIGEASASIAGLMTTTHHDKLDGIESGADVTDATNVTAAGALMDSELTAIAAVKGLTANGALDWTSSSVGTIHSTNIPTLNQSTTGQAATVATITGLAPDTATTQATQPNIDSIGTDGDTLNILADDVIMSNSTGYKTRLSLKNTTNNATCPVLLFRNDRDGNGLVDMDILGLIYFDGDDVAGQSQNYAYIEARAIETAHGDECGRFLIKVANNGTTVDAFRADANKATADEINVDIGNGATCIVETPGSFEATGFTTNITSLLASSSPGTAIPAGATLISTADGSAASDILTLPAAEQGRTVRIINGDADAVELQPADPTATVINNGSTGAGKSSTIPAYNYVDCMCFASNRWICRKTNIHGVTDELEDSH